MQVISWRKIFRLFSDAYCGKKKSIAEHYSSFVTIRNIFETVYQTAGIIDCCKHVELLIWKIRLWATMAFWYNVFGIPVIYLYIYRFMKYRFRMRITGIIKVLIRGCSVKWLFLNDSYCPKCKSACYIKFLVEDWENVQVTGKHMPESTFWPC